MTADSADLSKAILAFASEHSDWVLVDDTTKTENETDWGRWKFEIPGAVARPRNTQDVVTLVNYCRERGIAVTARAHGHSQSGQSTSDGGIVLDIKSMDTIYGIDQATGTVDCDGGVIWRVLCDYTVPRGYVPRVLTNNLAVCVAGTISVAGIGAASFRYGLQADNVTELEVVTGTGEVVTCSREVNSDLFDVVRCGYGQFGIITRAKVMIRECKPKVRMYHLLYDDLGVFMKDAERIMDPEDDKYHTLESRSAPCTIFTKRIGEGIELAKGMQTYAYWLYPLFLTVEYNEGEDPNDAEFIEGLSFYKNLGVVEYSQLEFLNRLEPIFELWHRAGAWEMAHPWMEVIMPWESAQSYIEFAQENLPPQALGAGGHVLLWPACTVSSDSPLFIHPQGKFNMGWGILPAVPQKFLDQALTSLDMASELAIGYGGKRYLSGYITFDTAEKWAAHFGDKWEMVCEAKARFDPDRILAPGFIQYE